MLQALEAFLDTPPLPCVFRCIFCHNFIAQGITLFRIFIHFPRLSSSLITLCSTGVNFRERDYPTLDAYVGEAPAGVMWMRLLSTVFHVKMAWVENNSAACLPPCNP
ncbi:hypothetical protein CK203_055906 [Vitis vinifera]|uniref:Uncharacterized protein n=1 Tax=Vitis vinifera TaxID=29760 RepID=A0A438FTY7_VITVI|nr:hypothetical protein CK203_055906 [Vitis vinifera]